MAVFGETLGLLRDAGRGVRAGAADHAASADAVRDGVASWPVQPRIVVGEQEKRAAFRIARAALAKSGTVTLELALAGVPMVAAYRAGAIEAWICGASINMSLGHPGQSRDRRECRAGIPAGRLHAGKACRPRCAMC